jgi:hypothetical protein
MSIGTLTVRIRRADSILIRRVNRVERSAMQALANRLMEWSKEIYRIGTIEGPIYYEKKQKTIDGFLKSRLACSIYWTYDEVGTPIPCIDAYSWIGYTNCTWLIFNIQRILSASLHDADPRISIRSETPSESGAG